MKKTICTVAPALALAALATLGSEAQSANNSPGIAFKAAFPGDAACLSRYTGFGDLRNNCTRAVEVIAVINVQSEGWHPTKVAIHGNNSWCQSVTTNAVGNGAQVGATTWTTAGPASWQTLNLGDRYVWNWAALVYRCGLEPSGVIGEVGGTL